MITIWFEGHSQTHDNVAGVAYGHKDVALTDLGREQAGTVMAARYAGVHFDALFTSDTQRSYDSARLMFAGRDVPIVQDTHLRECDYRDFEVVAAVTHIAVEAQGISNTRTGAGSPGRGSQSIGTAAQARVGAGAAFCT